MKTLTAIITAYLGTGIHFVWRDMREDVIRRPAYVRQPRITTLLPVVIFWLPLSVIFFLQGFSIRTRQGKQRITSLGIFAALCTVMLLLY
jgi:hypothetical protein